MSTITIGNCSLCGGPVVYPTIWYSTQPPEPFCSRCGARMARPTIQMAKPFVNQIDNSNPLFAGNLSDAFDDIELVTTERVFK